MLISVCIPEYNAFKYIERNLESLLKQTYMDLEIILYDDASKDKTREKMKEYSEKYPKKIFSYWSNKNGGVGFARNKALSYAKGEYIFFCDCDDYLRGDYIEHLADVAKEEDFPDIVIGGFSRVNDKEELLYERKYSNCDEALQQSIPLFAKLYKREFLIKNHIFSPEGVFLEDVLYQAKVIPLKPKIAYINDTGYIYVRNAESVSTGRLNIFQKDGLRNGFSYLVEAKEFYVTKNINADMTYYVVQYICWHLLKSGCKIGIKAMKQEYEKAFEYLDKNFPEYKKMSNISLKMPKGARTTVRLSISIVLILRKIHLARAFFYLYSLIDLGKYWPSL